MSSSPSPHSRTALGIGIVVVLAVVVVGSFIVFGGGGDGGSTTPSTTAPPLVDPNAPPELRNTGEDWDQIVRSIVEYRHWLFTHPDPGLLGNIETTSYSGYNDDELGLMNLATKGWRYEPPRERVSVEIVQLRERVADNVAILFIRFGSTPPIRVIDPTGTVIQDSAGVPPTAILWTLVREPATDAHWRLFKVTPLTDQAGPA